MPLPQEGGQSPGGGRSLEGRPRPSLCQSRLCTEPPQDSSLEEKDGTCAAEKLEEHQSGWYLRSPSGCKSILSSDHECAIRIIPSCDFISPRNV